MLWAILYMPVKMNGLKFSFQVTPLLTLMGSFPTK